MDNDNSDDATTAHDGQIREGDSIITPLDEDNDTPFSPPTDPVDDTAGDLDGREAAGRLDPTHQATDSATDIDSQQLYDEGLAGSAEAEEPNAGNTVVGYDPAKDERTHPAA